MTRKEFSTKSEAIRRIEGRYYFAFVGLALAAPIFGVFARLYPNHEGANFASVASTVLSCALIACVFGLAFLPRYFARRQGLICPACHRTFVYEHVSAALLTGNCSKCGNRMFDDGLNAVGEFERRDWFSKEQFKMAIENRNRNVKRRVVAFMMAGAIMAIVFVPLGINLSNLLEKGQLDAWLTFVVLRRVVAVLLGIPVPLYFGLFLFAVTTKQKRPLPCPECGRSILGYTARAALEKNICIYCGTQLFEAPAAQKA